MPKFNCEILNLIRKIPDPRPGKVVWYLIEEVVLLVILGVLSACQDWDDIVELGALRLNVLRRYLPYSNGIPTAQTVATLISAINPKSLNTLLLDVSKILSTEKSPQHVSIDGKHIGKGQYTVSAFNSENSITIAQSEAYSAGNELNAVKKLLNIFDLKGVVVTADALSCDQVIINKIKEEKGETIIALKKNKKYLYKQVVNQFSNIIETGKNAIFDYSQSLDKGHGRVEERQVRVLKELSHIPESKLWPHLKGFAEVTSIRSIKGKTTEDPRYFIMTAPFTASEVLQYVRKHWAIENNLHWVLDMNFKEDKIKTFNNNAIANMATIRRIVSSYITLNRAGCKSLIALQRRIARDEAHAIQHLSRFLNINMCLII